MNHRAAFYTVHVREKRVPKADPRPLGDIDEGGTRLIDVLTTYLGDDFEVRTEDGLKAIRCVASTVVGNELRATLQHSQTGVAADLHDPRGQFKAHQGVEDQYLVKCVALFQLDPTQSIGWLAVHINSGHGVKGLLAKGLLERFRQQFDDLVLEVTPSVSETALAQAVQQNRVDKVKLVKLERPDDRAVAATDKWVASTAVGRLELDVTVKGGKIKPDLLRRFLGGDRAALDEIIMFEGITFDEAKVEVDLPGDGGKRTYNIEKPEAGHAMTQDLTDLPTDDKNEPTEEGLFAALKDALRTVVT
jgi:hypothetical protein